MDSKMEKLAGILRESRNMVYFGGAGVSTESGIPDFRSADGIYHQQYAYPPEQIISHSFFVSHTEQFFAFYRDRDGDDVRPCIFFRSEGYFVFSP